DLGRARMLLRRAARAFGPREQLARARCAVAEAEIALAARELGWPAGALEAARRVLAAAGDVTNAAHASLVAVRRLLLLGRVDDAERALAGFDPARAPARLAAIGELAAADVALRRARARAARAALERAQVAAERAEIPALRIEVELALQALAAPA